MAFLFGVARLLASLSQNDNREAAMFVNVHSPFNALDTINQLVGGVDGSSYQRNRINLIALVVVTVLSWESECNFHKSVMLTSPMNKLF